MILLKDLKITCNVIYKDLMLIEGGQQTYYVQMGSGPSKYGLREDENQRPSFLYFS